MVCTRPGWVVDSIPHIFHTSTCLCLQLIDLNVCTRLFIWMLCNIFDTKKEGDLFMSAHYLYFPRSNSWVKGFYAKSFEVFWNPFAIWVCSCLLFLVGAPHYPPICGDAHQTHNAHHLTSKMGCTSAKIFWFASRFRINSLHLKLPGVGFFQRANTK